jgi:HPt (histidine-containing phosphotransfer) domain-containing protein
MDTLEQLREMAGGPMLIRTLKGFAAEIETTRTDLAGLIAEGNTVGASRVVHKLAGFGDMLGAQALCVELRKFEELIHEEDIAALEAALDRLSEIMTKTCVQVNNFMEDLEQASETSQ